MSTGNEFSELELTNLANRKNVGMRTARKSTVDAFTVSNVSSAIEHQEQESSTSIEISHVDNDRNNDRDNDTDEVEEKKNHERSDSNSNSQESIEQKHDVNTELINTNGEYDLEDDENLSDLWNSPNSEDSDLSNREN